MSFVNQKEMLREMEEHLGLECQEFGPLSTVDRLTIILFETVRHIPRHKGPKKGQVERVKTTNLLKP